MDRTYPKTGDFASDTLPAPVQLTVLTSETGALTKRYRATADGKVEKAAGADPMTCGSAKLVSVGTNAFEALEALKSAISTLPANLAVMTGAPPAGRDKWTISAKEHADPRAGVIARTKDYFAPVAGPAFLAQPSISSRCPASCEPRKRNA